MYFIASGAAVVLIPGKPVELGSGEFFGELALLTGQPRNADVVSLGYCRLLELSSRRFPGPAGGRRRARSAPSKRSRTSACIHSAATRAPNSATGKSAANPSAKRSIDQRQSSAGHPVPARLGDRVHDPRFAGQGDLATSFRCCRWPGAATCSMSCSCRSMRSGRAGKPIWSATRWTRMFATKHPWLQIGALAAAARRHLVLFRRGQLRAAGRSAGGRLHRAAADHRHRAFLLWPSASASGAGWRSRSASSACWW